MKSYTDIEQSKKLAEILPLESSDMYWEYDFTKHECILKIMDEPIDDTCIPAWSLAALLDVLPKYELNNFGNTIQLDVNLESLATEGDETLLDLVVNMIIHLHELKML